MGKKHFCFFQTAETGNRTPNSGVKGSGANHYPRAPALATEEDLVITATSKVISASTKVILATEEVVTATLKII